MQAVFGGCARYTEKHKPIMYNPLKHKKPYGAAVAGKEISIVFPLDAAMAVKRVFVVLRKDGCENLRYELPCVGREGKTDIFGGAFSLPQYGIWHYRFEGELGNGDFAFFGRGSDGTAIRGDWLPEWQLTVTKTDYKTPDWAKCGVIYQIFADRFSKKGDRPFKKSGRLHSDWHQTPCVAEEGEDYRADDFFGGNCEGIRDKLGYLKDLGVSCIYLSPIFESASNHRYDTGDYCKIDELFGDEAQFARLVADAGAFGINVILDGVFNHTGADSVYFNKFGTYPALGAYQSKASPYYDWYYFYDFPEDYHCWWGSTVVPTVNKSAKGYRQLILGEGGVLEKWSRAGVKGWRLDVVDELPVDFTDELCAKIKSLGEDMLIIGEVWEDATTKVSYGQWRPYFMGSQLDGVMNYPFKQAIIDFVLEGNKDDFIAAVSRILENYPKQSLDVLMNLIDSHDTVRALTRLSGAAAPDTKSARAEFRLDATEYARAKKRLKSAALLQYTLPGVPCVFYGDEAGVQGFEDPCNRAAYPWGREDKELIEYYRSLGAMRSKYARTLTGETVFVEDAELLIFDRISPIEKLRVFANPKSTVVRRYIDGYDALTGESVCEAELAPYSARCFVISNR